ncbi:12067_t:CDS:2, partial [Funneliformis geosporum]
MDGGSSLPEEQKKKHIFLVNWVIIDQQPFTLVENQSFKKFILEIQPRYKLPSQFTLKNMITSKFEIARVEICNYLQLLTFKVSLTMDIWQFEHFVLDVLYIPSPHDAPAIKNAVLEITNELQVADKLIGITTDNETKMIVVTPAFEANVIPLPVKKLCIFINMIRNFPKQMDKLKKYFRIEDIDFKTPLPDITTRWNFTYFMIERASEIKPLLAHLVSSCLTLTNNWPTDEEWIILNDLLTLLAPFALMTKVISASSYPTIGEVKWLFLGIKHHLERIQDNNNLQAQVYEMKRVFDIYFDYVNQSLHIPAFFDSRYKKTAYGNMSREDILQPIRTAMINYKESDTSYISQNTIVLDLRYQLTKLSTSETQDYFRNFFMPISNQQP